MSFISNFRADRLIAEIKSGGNPTGPVAQKALARLAGIGANAIAPIVAALASADKHEMMAYVGVLAQLVDAKTVPMLLTMLAENKGRAAAGISWALSTSNGYPPGALLEALGKPNSPKPAILDIISAQKARYNVRDLLNSAFNSEASERIGLFRIIGEVADDSSIDDLLLRIDSHDPIARVQIINLLGRFNTPRVTQALQKQLTDKSKFVRAASLVSLGKMDGPFDIKMLCGMLRDPEFDVQNKVVDLVIKVNDPETVKYLVDVLKDENEYARRSAVEVLNHVGDAKSVKYLLEVIADSDWWVRTRAADALGKIGGPRVVEAVLELIRDENQDVRRAAIEILNQTKDDRAVAQLIEATKDSDWWVSERAVDALAEIGSDKALPRLKQMLGTSEAKSLPTVIRALGKIGNADIIDNLLVMLQRPESAIRVEAIQALAKVTDEKRADTVRMRFQSIPTANDETVSLAIRGALDSMDERFSTQQIAANKLAAQFAEPQHTLLAESANVAEVVKQQEEQIAKLDIGTLKPGDIIEGRYKFIEKIGKGAFGTVLLMEDTIVDERLILKFLNPNVSTDEEMMKRFVHELRYSRKITHKNVIRIYDFLYIRGNYAISMEYFPSHTLGAEIVNEKPVDIKKAVRFGMDIATGMAVAHQVGIVHRDLKPANVLIDKEGLLKIVDFGVAAAHSQGDTQLTKTGYVIGSPKYMAPEQILGKKVDERADIYSLGIILYELFCGVPPYLRGDHMSVMYQHVQGKARPPIELNKNLPPGLNELVVKCMSLDKAKRVQTMDDLRQKLEAFL
jgi:HEAT repeat protein/tRNA A-37 threonylcarbamoyl transferase component Bud32